MKPLKIGLTGGIGSGKTTISKIFESFNIPIFNSDQEGKSLLNNNRAIITQIKNKIGHEIIENNQINKKKLAEIVFSNQKKLKLLNEIIHPHVLKTFNIWFEKQKSKYIIKESAILFESKSYRNLDKIILVKSPLTLRINRVCKRDQRTINEVKNIISNQIQENQITKHIDYFLYNNKQKLLVPQVIKLHEKLKKL